MAAGVWRQGLLDGPERYSQLAVLPVTSVITSAHAGVYELVAWLDSVWPLLAFARERPDARGPVLWLVLGLVASANVAVIAQRSALVALPELAAVAVLAWAVIAVRRGLPARAR